MPKQGWEVRRKYGGYLDEMIVVLARVATGVQRLAGRLARAWFQARTLLLRRQLASAGTHLWIGPRVEIWNPERIHLGEAVVIQRDVLLACDPQGTLRLGDAVHVTQGCVIASGACELTIGSNTIIGEYSSIRNTNHGIARGQPIRYQPQTCRPIHIGQDVWIGRGCAILGGVTIGDGAVVGANSVVTRDVEPYAIVAGVPAQVLRYREE